MQQKPKRRAKPRVVEFPPGPNTAMKHPEVGGIAFGWVGEISLDGEKFSPAQIELRHGKHIGANHGFGAKHIWDEHRAEMAKAGFKSQDEVPAFVASIIKSGTPLYFEGGDHGKRKLAAVSSSAGTAILEAKYRDGKLVWSVVTAFARKTPNGTRVGAVQKACSQ